MMDPRRAAAGCRRRPSATLAELTEQVLHRGRRRPGARLRGRARRQRHDDRAGARHRPRAARRRAVRDVHGARRPTCSPPTSGSPCTRGRGRSFFPSLGAYVGGDIVAGMLATGMDRDKRTRLFIDVGTNCEIVLSDGDTILSTAAPAGPAFEGGAIRCGMRAADGAIEVDQADRGCAATSGPARQPRRDRRRRARGPVRLGPGRRGRRAGAGRAARRLRPVRRRGVAAEIAPALADRLTMIGEERVFVLHRPDPDADAGRVRLPLAARRPRAAVRQGRDLHRLDAAARAARARARRRAAGAAGRLVRQLPLPRLRGPDRPGARSCRCCASSRPATSPARARRWPCCRVRERAGAAALLEEVAYVELSDRPDFNDRFVEQLAF